MRPSDRTSMGGPNERFLATDWTVILRAQGRNKQSRRAALGELVGRYWKPVYAYLRRKGNSNEEAKDLTGLDESEGRNWRHWHHHTTLSMLAHAFLCCARVSWSKTHSPPLGAKDAETGRPGAKGAAA